MLVPHPIPDPDRPGKALRGGSAALEHNSVITGERCTCQDSVPQAAMKPVDAVQAEAPSFRPEAPSLNSLSKQIENLDLELALGREELGEDLVKVAKELADELAKVKAMISALAREMNVVVIW